MRQWHQGKEGFMKVTRIQDKYNPDKVWMIKRYLCGTFYVNQEIKGQKFYDRDRRMTTGNRMLNIPVKGGAELTEATMAAINSDGYAVEATASAGLLIAGCVQRYCDNRNGADGEQTVSVKRGTFVWENDGTIKETDILKKCYIKDEKTVTITADGSSVAGTILEVDDDGVTVDITQV